MGTRLETAASLGCVSRDILMSEALVLDF